MIINEMLPVGTAGYRIPRSLRFNSADSAYLNRTPGVAPTSNQIMTFSAWVKRSNLGAFTSLFTAGTGVNTSDVIRFNTTDNIQVFLNNATTANLVTAIAYRDTSAWYHIVVAIDTTQATAGQRIRIWSNGVLQNSFTTVNQPTQNATFPYFSASGTAQLIGAHFTPEFFHDGYLAEIHHINGQALDATVFGRSDSITGQWMPRKPNFNGVYGAGGFYLDFSDNSNTTAATLGADRSGNGNNFTPNAFSVAAGVGNDSLTDSPTDYFDGTSYHGNFPTFNTNNFTLANTTTNGNLDGAIALSTSLRATMSMRTGKWYWESTGGVHSQIGMCGMSNVAATPQSSTDGYFYYGTNGNKYNVANSAYGAAFTSTDTIGVAYNADAGTIYFSKNGTWQATGDPVAGTNPAFSGITGEFLPAVSCDSGAATTASLNFGQRPFVNAAPAGYKPLCTYNLLRPTFSKPDVAIKVQMFQGSASSVTLPTKFTPDFVYLKSAAAVAARHFDTVRGITQTLVGDAATAEATQAGVSVSSSGFTLPGGVSGVNDASSSYHSVALAKGPQYGFDIVTWTGDGTTNRLINHNLGGTIEAIICRGRSTATNWVMWHKDMATTTTYQTLDTNVAESTNTFWGTGSFTSTQFMVSTTMNTLGTTFVAYIYRSVPGMSQIGTIVNNNSANGSFAHLNFKPAWIMGKSTAATQHSVAWDSNLPGTNPQTPVSYWLFAGADSANTTFFTDLLSNGFKVRNAYTSTIRYIAFAQTPFKYCRAQ